MENVSDLKAALGEMMANSDLESQLKGLTDKETSTNVMDGKAELLPDMTSEEVAEFNALNGDDKGQKSYIAALKRSKYKKNPDGSYSRRTAEQQLKYDESQRIKQQKSALHTNLVNAAANSTRLGKAKIALKKALSKRARIVAYVVNAESKFEIVSKKNKEVYDLNVVNRAPSAIKAVVVKIPSVLNELRSKVAATPDDPELESKLNAIASTVEETNAVAMVVVPWDEFAKFLQDECGGYLHEDDSIFVPFMDRKGNQYNTPADITGNGKLPTSGSFVYLRYVTPTQKQGATTSARIYSIRHSIRTKILAPGNYIALKRWQTKKLVNAYTEADADSLIAAHLARFCKARKSEGREVPAIVAQLSPKATTLVSVNNGAIGSSLFFPKAGSPEASRAWINSADAKTVCHWFNKVKGTDGTVVSEYVSPDAIALVDKEQKVSKEGTVRLVAKTDELLPDGATNGTYTFSSVNFAKIHAALSGHVADTYNEIKKTLAEAKKSTRSKGTKTSTQTRAYTNSGEGAMANLTLEDITAFLAGKAV